MPLTVEQMIEYATRGHAWDKHARGIDPGSPMDGVNAFRSPLGGQDLHVNNQRDLADLMNRMIDDPDTSGVIAKNGKIDLYNSRTNTYMRFDPRSQDVGTVFRYPNSAQNFKTLGQDLGRTGELARGFDNSTSPGSARSAIESLGRRMNKPPLPNNGMRVSADYQGHMRTMDNFNAMRTPLDNGAGFVADVDARGRPSQMFFLDEAAGSVTEINGKNVTVHSFDNLPDDVRQGAASQFFNSQRDAAIQSARNSNTFAEVSEGGFDALKQQSLTRNPGKGFQFSSTSQVLNSVDSTPANVAAGKTFASANGFTDLNDMVRQYAGFSDHQMRMFDNVSSMTDADMVKLSETLSPAELDDLKKLRFGTEYTSLGSTDEAIEGLADFKRVMDGVSPASQTKILGALESTVDLARTADAASDTLRGARGLSNLVDVVRGIKLAKPALNVGKSGIVTTVAFTAASLAMTTKANAMMRDIADELHAQNPEEFTAEMRDKYHEMMDDVAPVLEVQSADPGPWAIFTMAGAETYAHNRFKDFSDEVGLSDEYHNLLAPSIVAGASLRGEIGTDTYNLIPETVTSSSDPLRELIEAKNAAEQAKDNYNETYQENRPPIWQAALMDMGHGEAGMFMEPPSVTLTKMEPDVVAAQAEVDRTRAEFQSEFDSVLSDPEKARALTEIMDKDDLIEIVERTAQYHGHDAHPMIQRYVEAQAADAAWYDLKGAWDNSTERDDAEQALMDNPEVMREFVSTIFVPEETSGEPENASENDQGNLNYTPAPNNTPAGSINYTPMPDSGMPQRGINFTPVPDGNLNGTLNLTPMTPEDGVPNYDEFNTESWPGLYVDTSSVQDLNSTPVEDFTPQFDGLDTSGGTEQYSDMLQPSDIQADGIPYYNLVDLPPIEVQASELPDYTVTAPIMSEPVEFTPLEQDIEGVRHGETSFPTRSL